MSGERQDQSLEIKKALENLGSASSADAGGAIVITAQDIQEKITPYLQHTMFSKKLIGIEVLKKAVEQANTAEVTQYAIGLVLPFIEGQTENLLDSALS